MKAGGSSAVMADRAHGDVAGDDAQTAIYRTLDYFPTPPCATFFISGGHNSRTATITRKIYRDNNTFWRQE